jgi:hypothetical protein
MQPSFETSQVDNGNSRDKPFQSFWSMINETLLILDWAFAAESGFQERSGEMRLPSTLKVKKWAGSL